YWQQIPQHFKHVNLDAFIIMPNHLHGIIQILWNNNPLFAKNENDNKKLHQNLVNNICNINFFQNTIIDLRKDIIYLNNDMMTNFQTDVVRFRRDAINRVSTQNVNTKNNFEKIQKTQKNSGGITGKHNPMLQPNSLSEMMRSFKARCTYKIRKNHDSHFQWQARFYDHIIRNEFSLFTIREYIINNPSKWQRDRNNKKGLWM
ncbi:MAG: hypothetical protein ABID45_02545, partial [Patescibacteria group bacterium]